MNIAKKANMYFKVATPTITNIGSEALQISQQDSNRQKNPNSSFHSK